MTQYQVVRAARRDAIEQHLRAGGQVKQTYHSDLHPHMETIFPTPMYRETDMARLAHHIAVREAGFGLPTTLV